MASVTNNKLMNLSNTLTPKSDQLNADDLIAGPRTIRITEVKAGITPEQPVSIYFDGDNGRPWKPSKGMRRVLVALYGAESSAFVDKRVTLFNEPSVTFGPDTTGGIRISHASGITQPVTIALTVKKGKRKPFIVAPLPDFTSHLEALKTAATAGNDALKAAWLAVPADIQAILRSDVNNLKQTK